MAQTKSITEIIRQRVQRKKGCWVWTGYTSKQGYGSLTNKGRVQRAHRFFYEQLVGPIPEGLTLDHLCKNKQCVNPEHLEPVSHIENIKRHYQSITHCKFGHEFTPENTYTPPKRLNRRYCKACQKTRVKLFQTKLQGGY